MAIKKKRAEALDPAAVRVDPVNTAVDPKVTVADPVAGVVLKSAESPEDQAAKEAEAKAEIEQSIKAAQTFIEEYERDLEPKITEVNAQIEEMRQLILAAKTVTEIDTIKDRLMTALQPFRELTDKLKGLNLSQEKHPSIYPAVYAITNKLNGLGGPSIFDLMRQKAEEIQAPAVVTPAAAAAAADSAPPVVTHPAGTVPSVKFGRFAATPPLPTSAGSAGPASTPEGPRILPPPEIGTEDPRLRPPFEWGVPRSDRSLADVDDFSWPPDSEIYSTTPEVDRALIEARANAVRELTTALIGKAAERIVAEKGRFQWLEDIDRWLGETWRPSDAWRDKDKSNKLSRIFGNHFNARTVARLALVGGVGVFGGVVAGPAAASLLKAGVSGAFSFGVGYFGRKRASHDKVREGLDKEIEEPQEFPVPIDSAEMFAKKIYSAILGGKTPEEIRGIIEADSENLVTESIIDSEQIEARKQAVLQKVSAELARVNDQLRGMEKTDRRKALAMTIASMSLGKAVKWWFIDGINPIEGIQRSLAGGSELMNRSASAVSEWWNTPTAESVPASEPSVAVNSAATTAPAAPQAAAPAPQQGIPVTSGAKEALAAQSHAQDLKDGRFTTPYERMSPAEKAQYDDIRSGRVAGTASPDALKPTVPPAPEPAATTQATPDAAHAGAAAQPTTEAPKAPVPEAPKADVAAAVAATPDTSAGGFTPPQGDFDKYVIGRVDINDAGVTKDQVNNGFSYIFKHQLMDHAEEYGFDGKGSKEAWAMRRLMEIMKEVQIDGKSVYHAQQLWATDEAVGKAYILDMDAQGKFSVDVYQKTGAGWISYDGDGADVKEMPLENANGGHGAGHAGGTSAHPEGTGTHAAAHAESTASHASASGLDADGKSSGGSQSGDLAAGANNKVQWYDKAGFKSEAGYKDSIFGQIHQKAGTQETWSFGASDPSSDIASQLRVNHLLPLDKTGSAGVQFSDSFRSIKDFTGSVKNSVKEQLFNQGHPPFVGKFGRLADEYAQLRQAEYVLDNARTLNRVIVSPADIAAMKKAIAKELAERVKKLVEFEGVLKEDIRPARIFGKN